MLIRINEFYSEDVITVKTISLYSPMDLEETRQHVELEGYTIMEEEDGGYIRMTSTIGQLIADISVYPK